MSTLPGAARPHVGTAGAPTVPQQRRSPAHPDLDVVSVVRELRHRGATTEDQLQFRPSLDELGHDRIRAALDAACAQGLVFRSCRGDYEALLD